MTPDQLAQMVRMMATLAPPERAALLTQAQLGFDHFLGLRFTWAAADKVVAELTAGPQHVQPYGLVHGGVYCSLAEAACSVGAALSVLATGHSAVGVENRTRFVRAARAGATLTVTATPSAVASRLHTWAAEVTDEQGRVCAEAEVVVAALPPGKRVAGAEVALQAEIPAEG